MKEELIHWLDYMIDLHRSLIELAERKKLTIIKNYLEHLEQCIREEQKYLLLLRHQEQERKKLVFQIMSGKSFAGSEPSIYECIAVYDTEEQGELINRSELLLSLIQQLKVIHQQNDALLRQSLQFVNMSLDALRPMKKTSIETINYQKSGKKETTDKRYSSGFSSSI